MDTTRGAIHAVPMSERFASSSRLFAAVERQVARISQNGARTRRKHAGSCGIISVVAANCLLQLRFEAIFICCLSVATSFGAIAEPGRIVIPANSSMKTVSAGLQKLSGRNGVLYIPPDHAEPLPLLILLHKAGGSASEWFSGGRVIKRDVRG